MLGAHEGTVVCGNQITGRRAVGVETEDTVISTLHPSPESKLRPTTHEQFNFLLSNQHSWFNLVEELAP